MSLTESLNSEPNSTGDRESSGIVQHHIPWFVAVLRYGSVVVATTAGIAFYFEKEPYVTLQYAQIFYLAALVNWMNVVDIYGYIGWSMVSLVASVLWYLFGLPLTKHTAALIVNDVDMGLYFGGTLLCAALIAYRSIQTYKKGRRPQHDLDFWFFMLIPLYTCLFLHNEEFEGMNHFLLDITLLFQTFFLFYDLRNAHQRVAVIKKPTFLLAMLSSLILIALEGEVEWGGESKREVRNYMILTGVNAVFGLAFIIEFVYQFCYRVEVGLVSPSDDALQNDSKYSVTCEIGVPSNNVDLESCTNTAKEEVECEQKIVPMDDAAN